MSPNTPARPTAERVLIVGATSTIAHAVARRLAARGAKLALVARDPARLEANAADLRVRGAADVACWSQDLLLSDELPALIDALFARWGGFDTVLLAQGVLPDQAHAERSVDDALASFDLNARSMLALALPIATRLQQQGHGVLALIASPAGERGRRSNYVYGAGKAAVIALASGLRHRLHDSGVRVLTIQPGFVLTPMTEALPDAGGPLWASADRVAEDIERALGRGFGTVYTPWWWQLIMGAVRALPERLFVRTRL